MIKYFFFPLSKINYLVDALKLTVLSAVTFRIDYWGESSRELDSLLYPLFGKRTGIRSLISRSICEETSSESFVFYPIRKENTANRKN